MTTHYLNFDGRARRSEYWYYMLFQTLITYLSVYTFTALLGETIGSIISFIVIIVFALPSLAVTVRRLHDTDKSGWMLLIAIIPFLGGLILLVFFIQDSQEGRNKYGANPKSIGEDDVLSENLI